MNTMHDLFERFAREHIPTLAPRTQIEYARHLRVLRRDFGDKVPGAVKPRDVGRWMVVDRARQLRNKQLVVLSTVMSYAVGVWFIDGVESNPCKDIKKHPSKPRSRYITDNEFWAVHSIANETVQIMMELALLTGQRGCDLLDLQWADVLDDHIVMCPSKTRKKTNKAIGIWLTPEVCKVLLRARRRGPRWPCWYVIRTYKGEPYTHEGFKAMWQRTVRRAFERGLIRTRYTFHDIRAKCLSDRADKAGIQAASDLALHSDPRLTLSVYKRSLTMVQPHTPSPRYN